MRTLNAIKKIIEMYSKDNLSPEMPFWRVVKKDKTLIDSKNYKLCATKLKDEGFALSYPKPGKIKVDF